MTKARFATTSPATLSAISSATFAAVDLSQNVPISTAFDDIYFSCHDGIGESRYYFIEGNALPSRFEQLMLNPPISANREGTNESTTPWQNRNHSDTSHHASAETFTVAETGFGTGLNFLLTAALWHETLQKAPLASTQQLPVLQFISTEKYPISPDTLAAIYEQQQWHSPIAKTLLAQYTNAFASISLDAQRLPLTQMDCHIAQPNVEGANAPAIALTLLLGDASERLASHDFIADAWFLDGFAPQKNPEMWTTALFSAMANHSHSQTTFATFTAASAVRKGLQQAGFLVEKAKGFGNKREHLIGRYKA